MGGRLLVPVGTLGMHCHPYSMLRLGTCSLKAQWDGDGQRVGLAYHQVPDRLPVSMVFS